MQRIKCSSLLLHLSSIVALALAVVTGPAFAQKAERPEVKVGDRWTFEELTGPNEIKGATYERVITSVTPAGIEGTDNGQKLAMTPDLNLVEWQGSTFSDLRRLSFPLEIGKNWEFASFAVSLMTGKFNFPNCRTAVTGYEKLRVPAGEFDAFKLETKCDALPAGQTSDPSVRTWKDWYAPATHSIIKTLTWWGTSTANQTGTQLTSFKLQP